MSIHHNFAKAKLLIPCLKDIVRHRSRDKAIGYLFKVYYNGIGKKNTNTATRIRRYLRRLGTSVVANRQYIVASRNPTHSYDSHRKKLK